MRLIEADALKEATEAHGEKIAYVVSLLWDVDAAPTIAAIPVEWLKEHDGINIIDSDGNIYARRRITVVEALSMWQKEQEAQDG